MISTIPLLIFQDQDLYDAKDFTELCKILETKKMLLILFEWRQL